MWRALSTFPVKLTVEVNLALVSFSVINERCVDPLVFVSFKIAVEVRGAVSVRSPVCLVEESAVTDTVMDTLAGLTEEELVSAEVRWLEPCCKCVTRVFADDWRNVDWCSQQSVLEVSCFSWARACRCTAVNSESRLSCFTDCSVITIECAVNYNG